MTPLVAAVWTCSILCLHAVIVRHCHRFLAETPSPAAVRRWRRRFVVLDLLYGLCWTAILLNPTGVDVVSGTLMMFLMLLVVAVSSMLAASLPIAAFAATAPVTLAVALKFAASGTFDNYVLAVLAVSAEGYFALLAHRLHSTTLAGAGSARGKRRADRRTRTVEGDFGRSAPRARNPRTSRSRASSRR